MAAEYFVAGKAIVALVNEVLEAHHTDLLESRIGILMRDVGPRSNGKRVMGKAKKVGPEQKALLPHDFIIWFSQDVWDELDAFQHRALVDHLLCHCTVVDDKIKMAKPDIVEFDVIFERYGFWWPMAEASEQSIQARLGLGSITGNGAVEAVQTDVLEQTRRALGTEDASLFGDDEESEDDEEAQEQMEDEEEGDQSELA